MRPLSAFVAAACIATVAVLATFTTPKDLPPLTQQDAKTIWAAWWPTMLIASGLMLALTQGHRLGVIRHGFARKAIHIFMGTVYMACWPLFPEHPYSRVACAVVPLLSTAVVGAVGAGVVHEPALIAAASREGMRHELLRGPVLYGGAIVALTLCFWRATPAGVMAIAVLCIGDGLAEIIGRRYGTDKLPHNREKSHAGSLACLLGGFVGALLASLYFRSFGLLPPGACS